MTPTELAAVIEDHRLWLAGKGGKRANLRYADLSHADMSYADLRYADLYDADLYDANMSYTSLSYANLSEANLRYADLRGAILDGADMSYASLSFANLSEANMSYTDLSHADMSYADMSYAFLCGASLDETKGLVWARSGPCGIGPREILGRWSRSEGLVIEAGCFRGSPAEMRARVAAGGWRWPASDRDRLAASVEKHLARVEGDVTEWLAACGGAA